MSQLDLWMPLFTGATTRLLTIEERKNPRKIAERIQNGMTSVVQATPTVWQEVVKYTHNPIKTPGKPLRVISSGEALAKTLANELSFLGTAYNAYGPTETTIYACAKKLEIDRNEITIGTPLTGVDIYIVKEDGTLAKPYESGEIYIGGGFVSKGYVNAEEETRNKFCEVCSIVKYK